MPPKTGESVPVRLTHEQADGLNGLASSTGISKQALIRCAIDGILEYARVHKGRVMLPLDFTSVWRELADLDRRVGSHLSDHPLGDPAPRGSRLSDEGREDVHRAMDSAADKRNKDRSSSEKP